MVYYSYGYEYRGEHRGLGLATAEPPEAFAVREHNLEDGSYREVRYVPERTCNMVPLWEEPDADGYVTCECDACGWMADYAADCAPTGWCAGCGAKVREES